MSRLTPLAKRVLKFSRTSPSAKPVSAPSLISGQSALRYEDLIIGDQGQIGGPTGPTRRGTGVVRITGFASLYNNDYNIIPPEVSPPNVTSFGSTRAADDTDGFDVFVGRAGTGTLEITAGARAEIEDAAILGDLSNSAGTLVVDGVDSFFGSGGFQGNAGSTQHLMIIGHLGTGTMSVTNGGQVYALAPKATAQYIVAAVIGGDPTSDQQPQPFPGGQGSATVDGLGSKWIVGGSLQVGGFDSTKITNPPATQDLPGAMVQYPSNSGHGILNVNKGALVNVVSPTVTTSQGSLDLDVLVGLNGQIQLAGGTLQIDNGAVTSGSGQQAIPSITTYRLLNDGMVGGSGTITIGQFRNRSLGQVHVAAGDKLVVNSTGDFIANSTTSEQLLSNYGLMDVLGTETTRAELDFNASPTPITGSTTVPRPFVNFQQAVAPTNGGRQIGQITVQDGTLRFQSGLENHGFLAFTGGRNVVSGKVFNCFGNDPACVAAPTNGAGTVSVSGNGTSVTFEDNTFLAGNFQVLGINNTVSFKDPPVISGLFNVQSPTANISVIGDLILANGADVRVAVGAIFNVTDNLIIQPGFIRISPLISGLGNFAPGDLFTIMTYGGSILPSDVTFTTTPLNLGNGLTLIPLQPADTPHLIVVKIVSSCRTAHQRRRSRRQRNRQRQRPRHLASTIWIDGTWRRQRRWHRRCRGLHAHSRPLRPSFGCRCGRRISCWGSGA